MFTYENSFESNISLLLREIRSPSLTGMKEATIEVEVNLLATKIL